jgi:hypothetical protein
MRALWVLAFLVGCAASSPKPQAPAARAGLECNVRVMQEGKEVAPRLNGAVATFKLEPDDFRIHVEPTTCTPTITLITRERLDYVMQTPLVFAPGGVFMAGSTQSADILAGVQGDNPRASLEEVIAGSTQEKDWAHAEYKRLCGVLGYCPTPVLAFSSAWPFLDPATRTHREFAEFRRFTPQSHSMGPAAGRQVYAVVYTFYRSVSLRGRPIFYVLRPHALALDFR